MPKDSRLTVQDQGDTLRFVIRPHAWWYVMAFCLVWFAMYLLLGLAIVATVILFAVSAYLSLGDPSYRANLPQPSLVVAICLLPYLILWLVMGLYATWKVVGQEGIHVSREGITQTRRLLSWKSDRHWRTSDISSIKVVLPSRTGSFSAFWQSVPGPFRKRAMIVLTSGRRTFHLARILNEEEASKLIALTQDRFPQYRQAS